MTHVLYKYRSVFSNKWLVFFLLVVFGILCRVPFVSDPSLYLDEAFSIFYAQQDIGEFWHIFEREANPPLHFVTLHFWMKLFGVSLTSARMLSVVAMALAAAVGFRLFQKFATLRSALIFFVLFTFSQITHNLAIEARGFALLCLFSISSLYFVFKSLNDRSWNHIVFAGVFIALMLYTHFSSFLFVAMLFIAILLSKFEFQAKKRAVYGLLLAGLLCLPLLTMVSVGKMSSTSVWLAPPVFEDLKLVVSNWFNGQIILRTCFYLSLLLIPILAIKKVRAFFMFQPRELPLFIGVCGIGGLILAFFISDEIPLFLPKYLMPYLMMLTAWLALVVGSIKTKTVISYGLGIGLGLLVLFTIDFNVRKEEDWKGLESYVHPKLNENCHMIISPVYMYRPYIYYHSRDIFKRDYQKPFQAMIKERVYCTNTLEDDFFNYIYPEKMIFVQAQANYSDPKKENLKLIQKYYGLKEIRYFEGMIVYELEKK